MKDSFLLVQLLVYGDQYLNFFLFLPLVTSHPEVTLYLEEGDIGGFAKRPEEIGQTPQALYDPSCHKAGGSTTFGECTSILNCHSMIQVGGFPFHWSI